MIKVAVPVIHVSNAAAAQEFYCTRLGDGVVGGVVNLVVDSVDELRVEFLARGVQIAVGPVDQTWGTREMYVKDADGNCLRFQS